MLESLITSLFLLQVKETGLLPLKTLHAMDKSVPIFFFGINSGATSGLSAFKGKTVNTRDPGEANNEIPGATKEKLTKINNQQ